MSYHVTILRTKGKRSVPITQEEVLALAAAFPEWTYDAEQKALVLGKGKQAPALWFAKGELWTKNPSEDTLTAMLALARELGARVRGDELETYRTATQSYLHPDDARAKAESDADTRALIRRTRLRSLALHAAIFGSFALLIVLFAKLGLI